eukprot:1792847-Rhodomonas_salina.1
MCKSTDVARNPWLDLFVFRTARLTSVHVPKCWPGLLSSRCEIKHKNTQPPYSSYQPRVSFPFDFAGSFADSEAGPKQNQTHSARAREGVAGAVMRSSLMGALAERKG